MVSGGDERLGPYRLVQQLGEGGMGVVHLAVDPSGRAVAIKVLRAHIAHDDDARARLAREVQTLARVRDPRVAAVLDADTDGPRPYIVTRYVPGPPLDRVVADTGPLRGEALLRLGRGLSDALTAIHRAGSSTGTSSRRTCCCWTAIRWSSTSASPTWRTTSA